MDSDILCDCRVIYVEFKYYFVYLYINVILLLFIFTEINNQKLHLFISNGETPKTNLYHITFYSKKSNYDILISKSIRVKIYSKQIANYYTSKYQNRYSSWSKKNIGFTYIQESMFKI